MIYVECKQVSTCSVDWLTRHLISSQEAGHAEMYDSLLMTQDQQ